VLIHVKAGYHPLLINLITMKHCEPRSRLPLSDRLSAGHSAEPTEPILEPHEMTCRPKYKAIGAAEGDQCHRYDLKPKKVTTAAAANRTQRKPRVPRCSDLSIPKSG
jgi:hypothetical protein